MKIAISGSTGLVGSALIPFLHARGHQVVRLVRNNTTTVADGTSTISWDPSRGQLDAGALEGVDAVINLAGAGIMDRRWSDKRKNVIRSSRVDSTALLARTLASLKTPPRVFFSASAIGYYPTNSDLPMSETQEAGHGFLAEVCQAWEAATVPAKEAGIRTVLGRFGIVLSAQGGALAAQLPLFRWCVGGRLGTGKQYVSWIVIDDLLAAIYFCLRSNHMSGPVNLTSPGAVTNQEFTKTLGHVLHRPTVFPAPMWGLRLALGERADALLATQRVIPDRLQSCGFAFDYPSLADALRHQLGSCSK